MYVQADEDGKIIGYRETDGESLAAYLADGERLVASDAPYPESTHYVNADNSVLRRPTLTPGHEGIPGGFRLQDLPTPCRVHVDELVYDVDDGELEWTTPVSGIHQVRVEAWPYLDWERPVEVVSS